MLSLAAQDAFVLRHPIVPITYLAEGIHSLCSLVRLSSIPFNMVKNVQLGNELPST
jgi:hypothetical protein